MAEFTGQLKSNEIFASLFNMIISQYVIADNVYSAGKSLMEEARVDGSLYGDTKIYYSTDVLRSHPWAADAEATNLLAIKRPKAPKQQAITLDVFRQIDLTVDDYLSKRAWATEGAFMEFNSQMLAWMRETKDIHDATTYNSFIGTNKSAMPEQNLEITMPTAINKEENNRLRAQTIAKFIADLLVDLEDVTRNFNDYKHLRSFNPKKLVFVWNAKYLNEILKIDLPTIYHDEELFKGVFDKKLPARFFGTVNPSGATSDPDNKTVRYLVEKEVEDDDYFPGDLVPDSTAYEDGETYTQDDTVICKIYYDKSVPFMSAFEAATSFFNPKSLTSNHYLTWGRNTLQHLSNYPYITIKEAPAAAAAATVQAAPAKAAAPKK